MRPPVLNPYCARKAFVTEKNVLEREASRLNPLLRPQSVGNALEFELPVTLWSFESPVTLICEMLIGHLHETTNQLPIKVRPTNPGLFSSEG